MTFKMGQIVWVESSSICSEILSQYWPAIVLNFLKKFIQKTNIQPLCMINIYSSKLVEGVANFLVQFNKIEKFQILQVKASDEDFNIAYKKAIQDYKSYCQKQQKKSQRKQIIINTALDLCFVLENMFNDVTINELKQLPIFKNKNIPLKQADLQIYFMRKTTQLLTFFIQKFDFTDALDLKTLFSNWQKNIVEEIITKVSTGTLNLIPIND